MAHGLHLLPDLCRRDRLVAAGGCGHDAGRRCVVRSALGHHHRFLCLESGRDAGFFSRALSPARLGARTFRRPLASGERRHQEGWRVLSVYPATGGGDSVLCHQPRHGADAHPHGHILYSEPGRHARGYDRLRERRNTARKDRGAGRYFVTGLDHLVCTRRSFPAYCQEGGGVHESTKGAAQFYET